MYYLLVREPSDGCCCCRASIIPNTEFKAVSFLTNGTVIPNPYRTTYDQHGEKTVGQLSL